MKTAAAVLTLFAALLAAAQEKLVESIDVRVVNVDVVVTDRSGNRVTGLTERDFEVFEDRKRQTITNFYEVRGDEVKAAATAGASQQSETLTAAEVRPRRFVLFVDSESIPPARRPDVLAALETFVERVVRPEDQASVVNRGRELEIVQPLTSDHDALKRAIRRVAATPSPSAQTSSFAKARKQCLANLDHVRNGTMAVHLAYDDCVTIVRGETNVVLGASRRLASALDIALGTVAGAEGKKVLVLIGAYLPKRPGVDMFQMANQLYGPYMRGFDKAFATGHVEESEQQTLLKTLAKKINAHGVTAYAFDAPVPIDGVEIQSKSGAPDGGTDLVRIADTQAAYELLTDSTGGLTIRNPANAAAALERIGRDVDSYYSLGFRPSDSSGRDRELTVTTRRPGLTVRARRSYVPRTAEEETADKVVANIFSPDEASAWAIRIQTGKPERQGKNFVVPIDIVIPPKLTLLPREEMLIGGFKVYVAVGTSNGALSTTFRQPNAVTIRASEERGFRGEPIVFSATLTVRPGENLLSVGVVDEVSNETGYARATIVAE